MDRLTAVTAQFLRIGVSFERVAGVDAREGAPFAAPPLTEAEVCCFLSHRRCWQIIADGPDQYAAVFEDDVVFSHDAGSMLLDESWVPRDADVVKIETFYNRVRVGRRQISAMSGYSMARLFGQHLGSCGYLISKPAARRLLKTTVSLKAPVDVALFSPGQMTSARNNIYQLMPALCAQAMFWDGAPPTQIQLATRPHRNKRPIDRVRVEATRTFGHFRNWSFFATQQIDEVPLRLPRAGEA
ncbi:glycosyltransferase family 25 protein [Mesorhizobium sp.]|uniref:glycosyltransferase family 25 protein n=1 Tax=Mesorhizobium sp. TaxID=1871066 RepID=UPI001223EBF8|nr:glycosyltransferase family 25 protein [Mesorhizobium sp.]TJV19702.1 MAG: glycosyltransferase family 25 protein [Mesorhizobium sp.]